MNSNIRRAILGLLLLVGVITSGAVAAQAPISNVGSGSIEDRVATLERTTNAQGQLLTQLQQQSSDNQRDIDTLRGQIQESQYQLQQVIERQKQIYQQIDKLSQGGQNSATPDTSSAAPAQNSATSAVQASAGPQGEKSDYDNAVALARDNSQHDKAIPAFQAFIKQYPKSVYLPNANYWLGQLFYANNKKDDAAYYLAVVVKNYPKSPKAPEAMYKVGIIMQEKGQAEKAKAVFQQVIKQYPNSESAKQAKKRIANL